MENENWVGDRLGRKAEAEILYKFLIARHDEREFAGKSGSYVLNLDASWGHGKTFFLERFAMDLRDNGHVTCEINAWLDDAIGEPLVSVLSSIEKSLKPYLSKNDSLKKLWIKTKIAGGKALVTITKGIVKEAARKVIGSEAETLSLLLSDTFDGNSVTDDDDALREGDKISDNMADGISSLAGRLVSTRIDAYEKRIHSINSFKSRLSSLLGALSEAENISLPMFILIDEMDRCRPTYSIEMLEQIKHLFDVSGVNFVLATDTQQLAHSICAVYGAEFSSKDYLRRFFNRTYTFLDPSLDNFVGYLFSTNNIDLKVISSPLNDEHIKFFANYSKYYSLGLRDVEQCFDIFRTFVTMWDLNTDIELLFLFPLIVFQHRGHIDEMKALGRTDFKIEGRSDLHWNIVEHNSDQYGMPGNPTIVPISSVFNSFALLLRNPVSQILKENIGNGSLASWIKLRYSQEFKNLHANKYTSPKPYSIILDYADRLLNLGGLRVV